MGFKWNQQSAALKQNYVIKCLNRALITSRKLRLHGERSSYSRLNKFQEIAPPFVLNT